MIRSRQQTFPIPHASVTESTIIIPRNGRKIPVTANVLNNRSARSRSFFPSPDTPEFFFVPAPSPIRRRCYTGHRAHMTRWRMVNAARMRERAGLFSSLSSSFPYSTLQATRKTRVWFGLAVGGAGLRGKGVATGNANELHERR